MATIYTQQENNVTKTWLFLTMFFLLIIAMGFVFAQIYGNTSILYISIILSLVMNVGSYWWSDKIVLSMVHARQIEKKEDAPDLWNIVENLAITAGLPMPKLYIVDDPLTKRIRYWSRQRTRRRCGPLGYSSNLK